MVSYKNCWTRYTDMVRIWRFELMCDKSFPMMRRLFNAIVRPTVLYGCEVWAPAWSLALVSQLKGTQDIQLAFSAISVNSARASRRPTAFSGSLRKGLGWTAGGPWCLVSCADCRFCPRAACIWTFSELTLLMPGSRWCAPIGLWVLTGNPGTWAWALLSFPLGLGLWTALDS